MGGQTDLPSKGWLVGHIDQVTCPGPSPGPGPGPGRGLGPGPVPGPTPALAMHC